MSLPTPPPIPAPFPAYFIHQGMSFCAPSPSPPDGPIFEKKFCIVGSDQTSLFQQNQLARFLQMIALSVSRKNTRLPDQTLRKQPVYRGSFYQKCYIRHDKIIKRLLENAKYFALTRKEKGGFFTRAFGFRSCQRCLLTLLLFDRCCAKSADFFKKMQFIAHHHFPCAFKFHLIRYLYLLQFFYNVSFFLSIQN